MVLIVEGGGEIEFGGGEGKGGGEQPHGVEKNVTGLGFVKSYSIRFNSYL